MAAHWYIVHTYSNFEKKVADSITEQAISSGLGDLFEEVLVPTEEVVELRRGQKVNAERKFFPGYVLVKMDLTDQAYHWSRKRPRLRAFWGSRTSQPRSAKLRSIKSCIRCKKVLKDPNLRFCLKLGSKFV